MAISGTIIQSLVPVLGTATKLGGTAINRINLLMKNVSTNTKTFYIGSSTVTTSGATQGIPLEPGETLSIDATSKNNIYAIASASGESLNIIEVG